MEWHSGTSIQESFESFMRVLWKWEAWREDPNSCWEKSKGRRLQGAASGARAKAEGRVRGLYRLPGFAGAGEVIGECFPWVTWMLRKVTGLSHPERDPPRGLSTRVQQIHKKRMCGVFSVSPRVHCGGQGRDTVVSESCSQWKGGWQVVKYLLRTSKSPSCEKEPEFVYLIHKRHLHRIQGHYLIDLVPLPLVPPLHLDPAGPEAAQEVGQAEWQEEQEEQKQKKRPLLITEPKEGKLKLGGRLIFWD